MATYKEVLVSWLIDPDPEPMRTIVSIDENWNPLTDEDPRIFFYFASQEEFDEAKTASEKFDFVIEEVED